jgi:hypothetical protein
MNTEYVDGSKTNERFNSLDKLVYAVEAKVSDPNVKKITIVFPQRRIPSKKNHTPERKATRAALREEDK